MFFETQCILIVFTIIVFLQHLLWFKSHCLEFITTDCQFLILGNIQAYHWLCGFLLSTMQLVSQSVSVIYFWLFYSSLVYRLSLHIHMYIYRPSNCFFIYWGHCECLANLVGTVRVLSAVMFYETVLWANKMIMMISFHYFHFFYFVAFSSKQLVAHTIAMHVTWSSDVITFDPALWPRQLFLSHKPAGLWNAQLTAERSASTADRDGQQCCSRLPSTTRDSTLSTLCRGDHTTL